MTQNENPCKVNHQLKWIYKCRRATQTTNHAPIRREQGGLNVQGSTPNQLIHWASLAPDSLEWRKDAFRKLHFLPAARPQDLL